MKVTRFDPAGELIIVGARIWGPHGRPAPLRLVVDTGAAETMIVPEVLDELGFSARTHVSPRIADAGQRPGSKPAQ